MKTTRIIFWITTCLIFLTQGIGELMAYIGGTATEGIVHLGYPAYFASFLLVTKLLGSVVLLLPTISPRLKEWVYAGFTFDFLAASASIWVVDGFSVFVFLPVIALAVLAGSYLSYHKMRKVIDMNNPVIQK